MKFGKLGNELSEEEIAAQTSVDKTIKVLYLEDNPSDVDLLEIELYKRGNYDITSVETKEQLLQELEKCYDVLICDYSLPAFSGRDAVVIAKKVRPELPSVVLSGTVGEEEAVNILHEGAYDFVLKQNLLRLHRVIDRVIEESRHRAEAKMHLKELEDKNALLTSIFDGLDDIMFFKDTQGRYMRVNTAFSNHFQISEQNVIGKRDQDFFAEEIVRKSEHSDNQVLNYSKSARFNTDYSNAEGKRFVTETVKTPIISGGKVIGLVGISRDVTRKRILEEQLRRNQIILSHAEEIACVGSFELQADLGILRCTPNMVKILGLSAECNQIACTKLFKIVYEADRQLFIQQFEKAVDYKEPLSLTHRIQTLKGIRYCRTSLRPDLTVTGDQFYGTVVDITHERSQEDTIRNVQENERKRISRELHDGIGPKLSAASMYLDQLLEQEQNEVLEKIHKIVSESVDEVRTVSRNLSVKMVEECGLEHALEDLLDGVPFSIKKEVTIAIDESKIDSMVAAQLYRIVQEAINNMVKYAEARNFSLFLTEEHCIVKLTVKDDGKGCDVSELQKSGNGIKNILHRVRRCNGIIHFQSRKGEGFGFEIKVPVE